MGDIMSEEGITRREALTGLAGIVLSAAGCQSHSMQVPEAEAIYKQAKGLFSQSQFSEAKKLLDEVLKLDPVHVAAYYNRGLCHMFLGEWGLAEHSFDKAIVLEQRQPELYFRRAQVCYTRAKYRSKALDAEGARQLLEKTLQDLSSAIKLDDKVPDYYAFQAAACINAREEEKAYDALDKAVRLLDKGVRLQDALKISPMTEQVIREQYRILAKKYGKDT